MTSLFSRSFRAALFTAVVAAPAAHAEIIHQVFENIPESSPIPYTFGTDTEFVTLSWSVSSPSSSGYIYDISGTDVAFAAGVSSVDQITDASAYDFSGGFIGPIFDTESTGGLGAFFILRSSGTYAVARIHNIYAYTNPIDFGGYFSFSGMDGEIWVQLGGGTDFSGAAIPEPSTVAISAGLIALAFAVLRRRSA